jgi:hypothetical protein
MEGVLTPLLEPSETILGKVGACMIGFRISIKLERAWVIGVRSTSVNIPINAPGLIFRQSLVN